ncbi:unnamed protein product [Wuchereria bancrofti]|uniref:Uncharacterized protein n=1 Tax=Wuchereria bancrofti TaxID=6293 RepID=A0A3P7ECP2_WUCBA|nr:unnamed protein product [Wuchereria bancrofti]
MLGYSTEVNASLSRHQYSRETVRQESMLRNVYNVENIDEYDRSERNRNSLNYDNDYHDRHYYDPIEQSDGYFHPSTSGEQYQSDEYHNDNEARYVFYFFNYQILNSFFFFKLEFRIFFF